MNVWGQTLDRKELMKHIGDISQLCSVRHTQFQDGPGRGMRGVDVNNGAGLTFTVLPDRGMDIAWCHYKGIPISFVSKTGPVAPGLIPAPERGFLRGFYAGLLTTCGLSSMGAQCVDQGEELPMHGRAHTTVADQLFAGGRWEKEQYVLTVEGQMREAAVFHENFSHHREIKVIAGENRIQITDTIQNEAYEAHPFMLLYHFNFGYPLVSPVSTLETGETTSEIPRDPVAEAGFAQRREFQAPTHQYAEQVFYYDLVPDKKGLVWGKIINPELGIAATLRYPKEQLPYFIQWKQMGEGDYTCGLEPATWYPEGRDLARERGELLYLAPRETRIFQLEIEISEL